MTKKQIFILAAFVYTFLITFTYHPDIKTIFYQSQFFSQGVFNIYSFFANNPEKAFLGPFVYPPLAYFIYGILFLPVKFIAGAGFTQWLAMGSDAISVPHLFQYLFSIKLPAVIFHFLGAFFLIKLVSDKQKQKMLLLLWFFNPISIYVVAFMGQIDALAVFLTIISLYFSKKKPLLALIFIGFASAIKTYPLLLLPFAAFLPGKTAVKKALYLITGLIAYGVFILPFIATPSFYSATLVSGLSQRIFELKIPIGFGENILILPAITILTFLFFISKMSNKEFDLTSYFMAITFVISALTHFHPQWSLWFIPFMVLVFVKNTYRLENAMPLILMIVGWLGTIVFFEDKFLTWGIISPIDPGLLFLPSLASAISKYIDFYLVQSLFHTIFIVCGGFYIWNILTKTEK